MSAFATVSPEAEDDPPTASISTIASKTSSLSTFVIGKMCVGAALSMLDVITDLNIIHKYLNSGLETFGFIMLSMVSANLITQLLLVYTQQKNDKKALLKELFFVVTATKPARDVYKLADQREMQEHHTIDPATEASLSKLSEMACEAIPGCILQSFILMTKLSNGDGVSNIEFFSIAVSAASVGFTSALMGYDLDTSASKRALFPAFYGYIPDTNSEKLIIFASLAIGSASLLLIRSFSTACLMTVGFNYVLIYFLVDNGIYALQKLVRRDMYYWVPVYGCMGVFTAFTMRFLGKFVMDFTGMVQGRHPGELGGVYFTVNMFLANIFSAGSLSVYFNNASDDDLAFSEEVGWKIAGWLSAVWLASFSILLLTMKSSYRASFFDTTSGAQHFRNYFLVGDCDRTKAKIIFINNNIWTCIREDVKTWVQLNWSRWKEERPDWFTLVWQSKVPDEWITDAEERAALDKVREKGRRRSSVEMVKGVFGNAKGRVYAEGVEPEASEGQVGE